MTVLDEAERVPQWGERLRRIALDPAEREQVLAFVADPDLITPWLPAPEVPPALGAG